MKRRTFTLAGFFGVIGAVIGKAFASPAGRAGTPLLPPTLPQATTKGLSDYTIKVGRRIMRVHPDGRTWDVYVETEKTAGSMNEGIDVKNAIDQEQWLFQKENGFEYTQPTPREHLTLVPEGVKPWSEASNVQKPTGGGLIYSTIVDLKELRDELDHAHNLPRDVMRATVFALWRKIDRAIRIRETFCSGHNGPALGLTAEHCMTEMGDGRRLCPYCYKQETDHGLQLEGSDRGQAPSA